METQFNLNITILEGDRPVPLFDFYCKECMKSYEVMIKLDKTEKKIKCPHCKKILKKVINPVYFKVR